MPKVTDYVIPERMLCSAIAATKILAQEIGETVLIEIDLGCPEQVVAEHARHAFHWAIVAADLDDIEPVRVIARTEGA